MPFLHQYCSVTSVEQFQIYTSGLASPLCLKSHESGSRKIMWFFLKIILSNRICFSNLPSSVSADECLSSSFNCISKIWEITFVSESCKLPESTEPQEVELWSGNFAGDSDPSGQHHERWLICSTGPEGLCVFKVPVQSISTIIISIVMDIC